MGQTGTRRIRQRLECAPRQTLRGLLAFDAGAEVRGGIARLRDGRPSPGQNLGQHLRYRPPSRWVPAVNDFKVAIRTNEYQAGKPFEAQRSNRLAFRIWECQEPFGPWSEKLPTSVVVGGGDPPDSNVSRRVVIEDPTGSVKNPCAFVCVGVDGYEAKRIRGKPVSKRVSVTS